MSSYSIPISALEHGSVWELGWIHPKSFTVKQSLPVLSQHLQIQTQKNSVSQSENFGSEDRRELFRIMFGMCLKSLIVSISIFRVWHLKLSVANQSVSFELFGKQAHDSHDHHCVEGFGLQTVKNGKWKPLKKHSYFG